MTDKERSELDYLAAESAQDDGRFFRYKGAVYDLGEFVRIEKRSNLCGGFTHTVDDGSPLLAWHGIQTDSYFSGVLVRYTDNTHEAVIVGRVTS